MNSHQSQRQSAASPGRKPDNLNKDNLQPSSKTPNLTGSAGFIPQDPSGDATSSVKKYTADEILQMMKIDYSHLNNSETQAKMSDGDEEKGMEEPSIEQNAEEHWWFDDQGEVLFDHWRNGNGEELVLNSEEWGEYMRSNLFLELQISNELWYSDTSCRKSNGKVSGVFHANAATGFGYKTGYDLLGGSNADVGDLIYFGYVNLLDDGSYQYNLNFIWNDVMNPEYKYWGDILGEKFFPGISYVVRIHWQSTVIITPK